MSHRWLEHNDRPAPCTWLAHGVWDLLGWPDFPPGARGQSWPGHRTHRSRASWGRQWPTPQLSTRSAVTWPRGMNVSHYCHQMLHSFIIHVCGIGCPDGDKSQGPQEGASHLQWDSQPTRKWQSQGQSAHPEVRSCPAQGTISRGLCGGDLSPNPYSNRSPALWSSSMGAGWARHMQPTPHHFLIPSETCTAWHLTAQDPGCPGLPQGHLSFSQRTWEKERKNRSQWVNAAQQMKTRYFQKWKLESKKGLLDITNTVFTMV